MMPLEEQNARNESQNWGPPSLRIKVGQPNKLNQDVKIDVMDSDERERSRQ